MKPVQHVDILGPMTAEVYALMPYVFLAMIVGANVKFGLDVMGQTLEGRRPRPHAVLGIIFAALNGLLAWVLFVGLQVCGAGFMGQASIDATARRMAGTPDIILSLAQMPPWTLIAAAFGVFLGFILIVGRPAKRVRSRRRDWEEA